MNYNLNKPTPSESQPTYHLEALIFDVDGTLADTERNGHRVAFNTAFREAGLDWDWSVDLYGELLAITGGKERIRRYVDRFHPGFNPAGGLDSFIASLHQAKNRHYAAQGGIPLRLGVRRLIIEAREAGLRLAIATTTSLENVIALLEQSLDAHAPSWFEVIAAGDIVPAKKPAPDIYVHALARLGLHPAQCLAFEDSVNGLRAALAAGLRTVVTVNEYTRLDDFTGAAIVLDHLGDPETPARVLAGEGGVGPWIDVAALRHLHSR